MPESILLISAALPPAHDGIGDYTARLADALAADSSLGVRVWTAADGTMPTDFGTNSFGNVHFSRTFDSHGEALS